MQTDTQGSLRDKFSDFGAAPTAELWDSIAASLDEDKKRRGVIWWWMLGAAAAVAVMFTVYRVGYNAGMSEMNSAVVEVNQEQPLATNPNSNNVNDNNTATSVAADEQKETTLAGESNGASLEPAEKQGIAGDQTADKDAPGTNDQLAIQKNNANDQMSNDERTDEINPVKQDIVAHAVTPEYEHGIMSDIKRLPETGVFKLTGFTDPRFNAEPLATIEKKQDRNLWRIGATIGRSTYIDNGVAQKPENNELLDTYSSSSWANGIVASGNLIGAYDAEVRRPVAAELTVSRSLGRRWTLQSGLGVAFATSKLYYDIPDNSTIYQNSAGLTSVKSKYIGFTVPVHLSFDFIKRCRIEVYTGLGVSNEFPVYMKSEAGYDYAAQLTTDPALESISESKHVHYDYDGAVQYGVGFRWNFNEKLKLDLRPYMKYYFSEGGHIPSMNKAWYGASAGLTWAL